MRREIGSEFWSIPLAPKSNDFFAEGTTWFLSGRSALERIIVDIKSKRNIHAALLPSWCCDSMILPFVKHGIEVRFYPVFMENGRLIQSVPEPEDDEILFIMDYFGYTNDTNALFDKGTIIRDVTHSVFSKTYSDADYYFGSLRKWCGFKTGGFAIGPNFENLPSDEKYICLRKYAMDAKSEYICGKSESKEYLDVFSQAEEYLDGCSMAGADPAEIALASYLDIEQIKEQRRKNASVLLDSLGEIAMFKELKENDCPLFVPILVGEKHRDELRRHLISKEIYAPIHWPISKYHKLDGKTKEIYDCEISLVCDQRYGESDMYRTVEAINSFFKG